MIVTYTESIIFEYHFLSYLNCTKSEQYGSDFVLFVFLSFQMIQLILMSFERKSHKHWNVRLNVREIFIPEN